MMPAIKQQHRPRALVIEDEPILQIIHRTLLNRMGFEVIVVGDSQKAIAKWNEHWDLIFSDIGLPGIDGKELCRQRREFEKTLGIHTPSFAYTAFGSTVKDSCLEAGFDAFGVKPMDNFKLYLLLQDLLPQFELFPLEKTN